MFELFHVLVFLFIQTKTKYFKFIKIKMYSMTCVVHSDTKYVTSIQAGLAPSVGCRHHHERGPGPLLRLRLLRRGGDPQDGGHVTPYNQGKAGKWCLYVI